MITCVQRTFKVWPDKKKAKLFYITAPQYKRESAEQIHRSVLTMDGQKELGHFNYNQNMIYTDQGRTLRLSEHKGQIIAMEG